MPIISALGAMSSRGLGEFAQSQQTQGNYIENYFSSYPYNGLSATQAISNGVALSDTAAWSAYQLYDQNDSAGYGVTTDASGNFYVIGNSNDGNTYPIIAKYNSSGVIQWQRKLRQSVSGVGRGIAVDSSGNVYICGAGYTGSLFYIITAKYDSSGAIQWQRSLQTGQSFGYAVALDTNGNVCIGGSATPSSQVGIVAQYNSSGTLQWQRQISSTGNTSVRGVYTDSSNNIYAACICNDGTYDFAVLIKYNSSGTLQWQRQIKSGSGATQYSAITVDSSSNVYAVGQTTESSTYGFIVKYNSSGTVQWQKKYTPTNTLAYGVATDSSGNVYVAGGAYYGGYKPQVLKIDSSGTILWNRAFSTGTYATGVSVDTSGNVYASLNSYILTNQNNSSLITVKLKADGTTTTGTAFIAMVVGQSTMSAGTSTEAAGTAVDSGGSTTSATSTATDSAGTATASTATQAAVTNAGGLVWLKYRTGTPSSGYEKHILFDTARTNEFTLSTNNTAANETGWGVNYFRFDASGFDFGIGNTSEQQYLNKSGVTYASWTFGKKEKFFDVVTYTGNGVVGRQIPHNLGSVPGMIIIKSTSAVVNWVVQHRSLSTPGQYLVLNSDVAVATNTNIYNANPTSTYFQVGGSQTVNNNGDTYVAYLFAHNAGGFGSDGTQNVISCGSYTGTGTSGNAITLGYEPQFVLIKRANGTADWFLHDIMRGMANGNDAYLNPNLIDAETPQGSGVIIPTATGFIINTTGTNWNSSGAAYIYIAIRRGPMRTPTSGASVFNPTTYTGSGAANTIISTINQPDSTWWASRTRSAYQNNFTFDRLRGVANAGGSGPGGGLPTNLTDPEYANSAFQISALNNTSVKFGPSSFNGFDLSGLTGILWNFTRAPGFFEVTVANGNSTGTSDWPHNLGVAPEFIIRKSRTNSYNWQVWHKNLSGRGLLASSNAWATGSGLWTYDGINTNMTSAYFSTAGSAEINSSGDSFVTYLFASCPGVSKVGTYTGTGSTQTISCGFTGGARYVLIKRTDSTGDWWVWDTARGMVAGTDPRLPYNSTTAEANANWVYTTTGGFQIVTSDATVNASGGSYIYLAIA